MVCSCSYAVPLSFSGFDHFARIVTYLDPCPWLSRHLLQTSVSHDVGSVCISTCATSGRYYLYQPQGLFGLTCTPIARRTPELLAVCWRAPTYISQRTVSATIDATSTLLMPQSHIRLHLDPLSRCLTRPHISYYGAFFVTRTRPLILILSTSKRSDTAKLKTRLNMYHSLSCRVYYFTDPGGQIRFALDHCM